MGEILIAPLRVFCAPPPNQSQGAAHERDLAEREGFEPPGPFGPTVFKTAAFDHSATSPGVGENTENRRGPRKPGSRPCGQGRGVQGILECPGCHIKLR